MNINIDEESVNETIMIWLSRLFRNEINEANVAASNERLWALGSDNESVIQHEINAEMNRRYVELLKHLYNETQKYFGEYGDYIR